MKNLGIKDIFTINQICKNLRMDNSYTLHEDKALMFKREFKMTDQGIIKEDIGFTIVEFDTHNLDDTYHINNGQELYSVFKNEKGAASHTKAELDILHHGVKVRSLLEDIDSEYLIRLVETTEDLDMYEKYSNFIYDDSNIVYSNNIGADILSNIYGYRLVNWEIPNLGGMKLSKSLFKSLPRNMKEGDENNIIMTIKDWDSKHDVYALIVDMKYKKYNVKHIYKTILY